MPIAGVRVGHWTDPVARTGCTVVRFDEPNVASGEIRGGAPATREFALLDPRRMVERIDAVMLSGGSAFGLAAADGVVGELEGEGIGFRTPHGRVPIVVGLSLFDLGVGSPSTRPGPDAGAQATRDAGVRFDIGAVGAGTGATVGNWRGPDAGRDAGIGFAVARRPDITVAALVAVNAAGDIASGAAAATTRRIADGSFEWPREPGGLRTNTTIGVVVTDARLTKTDCRILAEAGHDGVARALVPAHTPGDGDALVVVSTGPVGSDGPESGPSADLGVVRLLVESAVERAITSVDGAPRS